MSVDELLRSEEAASPPHRGLHGLVYVLAGVLVLVLLAAAGVVLVVNRLGDQVSRAPGVFVGIDPASRPAASAGETFLLVGVDTRSSEATTGTEETAGFQAGAQRSDALMLATVADDARTASVVSIPRDSWVDIPGRGENKINAAFSYGGPPLLIETVEQLTRVRVDHFAVIDFAGFREMTDAAGGIELTVGTTTRWGGTTVPAGRQRLNGEQALSYVAGRYGLPAGDFDRVRRQQNALRALVSSALSGGTLSSPTRAYEFVDSVTRHVDVDDTLSNTDLVALLVELRDLRTDDIEFLTAPTRGTGMEGDQSVVYLDRLAADDLWTAVNADQVAQWTATRPQERLSEVPR